MHFVLFALFYLRRVCRGGWGMVIGELGHGRVTSRRVAPPSRLIFFPLSAAQLGSAVLESPQVVLLCADAFRQADVVHGHLTAPASPALPLQDDLVNSRAGSFLSNANQCSTAPLNISSGVGQNASEAALLSYK